MFFLVAYNNSCRPENVTPLPDAWFSWHRYYWNCESDTSFVFIPHTIRPRQTMLCKSAIVTVTVFPIQKQIRNRGRHTPSNPRQDPLWQPKRKWRISEWPSIRSSGSLNCYQLDTFQWYINGLSQTYNCTSCMSGYLTVSVYWVHSTVQMGNTRINPNISKLSNHLTEKNCEI